MKYSCIIVDDQKVSVDVLVSHVNKIPGLGLKLATTDPHEALTYLDTNKVDILFLDVEMPDLSGLDFVDNLRAKWGNAMPKVVFATSFEQYALAGYEYGVVDYILKPIGFNRFKKSIDRIIHDLDQLKNRNEEPDFFFLENRGKKVKINVEDILYLEGAGNYITIFTDSRRSVIHKSLNAAMEILPSDKFMRVHKSYIVAINKIHAIRGNEIFLAVKESKEIPVGSTYREEVFNRLKIL